MLHGADASLTASPAFDEALKGLQVVKDPAVRGPTATDH
jgi:hypothetical protein